jgi:hypothetical protein
MKINRHTRRRIKRFLRSTNGSPRGATIIPKFVYENGVEVLRLQGPWNYAHPKGALSQPRCDLSATAVFAAWENDGETLLKLVRTALVLSKE